MTFLCPSLNLSTHKMLCEIPKGEFMDKGKEKHKLEENGYSLRPLTPMILSSPYYAKRRKLEAMLFGGVLMSR